MMARLFETEGSLSLLQALILPPLLLIILTKLIKSYFSPKSSQILPPGPTPWPIIGNIPYMIGSSMPHVALTNLSKTYGPLISLKLGAKLLIVGSSPDAAKEILKTNDRLFSGRHVPQALPIPESEVSKTSLGWSDCGDHWKRLRTLCRTELFSNKTIRSQAETNIIHLVDFLRSNKEGKVVEISELVFATVFNVLGNALMSRDLIGLDERNEDIGLKSVVRGIMEVYATPNLADFYPILRKVDIQGLRRKAGSIVKRMKDVWERIVQERKKEWDTNNSCGEHKDFLDSLISHGFSDHQIYQLFNELFSAGTDTTTSTIEWTLAELMKNQESMNKVRQEIDFEIKQDFPKNSDSFLKLPYLRACVKETLRLHPPAPLLLPHRALETCQVMNYTIPKDAQVMINVWAIGRDPSIWEEPLKFKPERFLNSNIDFKGNDFQFIPFSAGRRICPGLAMAAETVPLILVSLIHFFNWSLPQGKFPDEIDMSEKFGVTMQMEHPLQLIPKARR